MSGDWGPLRRLYIDSAAARTNHMTLLLPLQTGKQYFNPTDYDPHHTCTRERMQLPNACSCTCVQALQHAGARAHACTPRRAAATQHACSACAHNDAPPPKAPPPKAPSPKGNRLAQLLTVLLDLHRLAAVAGAPCDAVRGDAQGASTLQHGTNNQSLRWPSVLSSFSLTVHGTRRMGRR